MYDSMGAYYVASLKINTELTILKRIYLTQLFDWIMNFVLTSFFYLLDFSFFFKLNFFSF